MSEELEKRVDVMKDEIDALQIAITGQTRPWYRDVSTLLSILALLFSFGTTYVSYRRTLVQDVDTTRQELRGLLQRLAALPKENVEVMIKYPNDPASRYAISGYINQESSLLSRNAAELAKKLPANSVSAIEFYAIAVSLQSSYDLNGANEFLNLALKADPDFNTEIASLRSLANMKYIQGRPEAGRVEYQRALDIFSKYPQFDPYTRDSTNVQTELSWAFAEANRSDFASAGQHIRNAEEILRPLASGPGADSLRAQVQQAKTQIQSGGRTPIPPAPLH